MCPRVTLLLERLSASEHVACVHPRMNFDVTFREIQRVTLARNDVIVLALRNAIPRLEIDR